MRKQLTALAAGAVLAAAAQSSFAGSLSLGGLTLSADVLPNCTVTASGKNFGVYAANAPDLANVNAGFITIACTKDVSYRILVDGGQLPTSIYRQLKRVSASELIQYVLKLTSGTRVGDNNPILGYGYVVTMPLSAGMTGKSTGASRTFPLIADVYFSTSLRVPGTYTDSVNITVHW